MWKLNFILAVIIVLMLSLLFLGWLVGSFMTMDGTMIMSGLLVFGFWGFVVYRLGTCPEPDSYTLKVEASK